MKQFRKNKKDLFICEECGKTYLKKVGLSKHINSKHDGIQEYYNKWLKENNEGNCNICNETTIFRGLHFGYKQTCENKKCKVQNTQNVLNKSIKEKYNVDNSANIPGIQDKKRKTCLEKYGVEISSQAKEVKEKAKKNNLEKYGVENVYQRKDIKEKIKHIHLKKLGVEYPSQSEKIKHQKKITCLNNHGVTAGFADVEKRSRTNLKKYKVEHCIQNREIFFKSQKSGFRLRRFKFTELFYRGSYELDFLEKFYDKLDIENGPTIKYVFNKGEHFYHSDFYIPSKNLIIEIKSSYVYQIQGEDKIEAKRKASISNGFNYILIINKNYSELEQLTGAHK
jgi:hypothetical protein